MLAASQPGVTFGTSTGTTTNHHAAGQREMPCQMPVGGTPQRIEAVHTLGWLGSRGCNCKLENVLVQFIGLGLADKWADGWIEGWSGVDGMVLCGVYRVLHDFCPQFQYNDCGRSQAGWMVSSLTLCV